MSHNWYYYDSKGEGLLCAARQHLTHYLTSGVAKYSASTRLLVAAVVLRVRQQRPKGKLKTYYLKIYERNIT